MKADTQSMINQIQDAVNALNLVIESARLAKREVIIHITEEGYIELKVSELQNS